MTPFTKPTLEQEFINYFERCHPGFKNSEKFNELREAFFAGVLMCILLTSEATNELEPSKAAKYIRKLYKEAQKYALQRVSELKAEDKISRAGNG